MERIYALIMAALGLAILWQGRDLSIGSFRDPGSGFFPAVMAVIILVLSVLLVLFPPKGARQEKAGAAKPGLSVSRKSVVRTAAVFVALMLYAFFLEYLGFLMVSFLLTTVLFVAFGSRNYLGALFKAALATGLAYGLFEVLLKSNLPHGVLGF